MLPSYIIKFSLIGAGISRYDIEPFFFSSSLNWIPSRFQEDSRENIGDRMYPVIPGWRPLLMTSI
jgi:hypothetical protein